MSADETSPLVFDNHSNTSDYTYSSMNNSTDNFTKVVVFIIAIGIALLDSTFIVEPGNIGLVVTLGQVTSYQSGLHYKPPFISRIVTFSAKTQKLEDSNTTPTKEGLSVQLDTAM